MEEKIDKTNNEETSIQEVKTKAELDLEKLREAFIKVVEKHKLKDEKKAKDIADYMTKNRKNKISVNAFAKRFKMSDTEARIFLAFILKGIDFKEKHLDKK